MVVTEDLNANSRVWGPQRLLTRAACPSKTGRPHPSLTGESVNTCVRQQGGPIVDVTFANDALPRRIEGWEMLEDAESLSDHRCIRYDVSALPAALRDPIRSPRVDGPFWALKRLDRDGGGCPSLDLGATAPRFDRSKEGSAMTARGTKQRVRNSYATCWTSSPKNQSEVVVRGTLPAAEVMRGVETPASLGQEAP